MKRKLDNFFANLPACLKQPKKKWYFGTAGYRGKSDVLLQTITRASLLALIRSATFCGKTIGIMITASHNKKEDNGIKIIDHNGDYIDKNLENFCDEIVNSKDLYKTLCKIHRKIGNMRDFGCASQPVVAIGRDTRESGEYFVNEIKKILEICGCRIIDYGIVTTPELHYNVRNSNTDRRAVVGQNDYINYIVIWYKKLSCLVQSKNFDICVDCAHGVGGLVIDKLSKIIDNKKIRIINSQNDIEQKEKQVLGSTDSCGNITKDDVFMPNKDLLNYRCGADYVITNNTPPDNINVDSQTIKRCASFDGDADRLVYFTCKPNFAVVGGDRTAVFLAHKISNLTKDLDISVGVVLSYYSNSAAISSIPKNVRCVLSNTGVKNFIKLSRSFDIGIFFEPNGHGSVTFSEHVLLMMKQKIGEKINTDNQDQNNQDKFQPDPVNDSNIDIKNNTRLNVAQQSDQKFEFVKIADNEKQIKNEEQVKQLKNIEILHAMSKLFDPCVGDAVANFLVIEALIKKDSLDEFVHLYKDLPTRMISVKVKRKEIFVMASDIEIVEPKKLKEEMEKLCHKYKGRSFVRPSGTENIIRVFAEAKNTSSCDKLCVNVAQAVYNLCDGIGSHPEIKY
ncbi:hypothetical protein BDAP_001215 [Binucleata daphniae]